MINLIRRVRQPFSNQSEGYCLNLHAQESYAYCVYRLCISASRASTLSGTPPSWDYPDSWDSSSLLGGLLHLTALDLHTSSRNDTAPTRACISDSEKDGVFGTTSRRFIAKKETPVASVLQEPYRVEAQTPPMACCYCFETRLQELGLDNRWVPPWLLGPEKTLSRYSLQQWMVTPAPSVFEFSISPLEYYAKFSHLSFLQGCLCHSLKFLSFFQGNLCHSVMLNILCSFTFYWVVDLSSNLCFAISLYVGVDLALRVTKVMLSRTWIHFLTKHGPYCGMVMRRPFLIWFKFSGLKPPWQVLFDSVCSNCLFRNLHHMVFVSHRDPLKQSIETATRKHCGVVCDGTIAQTCLFVVCRLRWEVSFVSMICFLSVRYSSSNIKGHGWELDSINWKTLVLWEATLYACFINNLLCKGLCPEFDSCYMLWLMQLLCKHLMFE